MTNFMSMTHVVRSQVEPYLRLTWFLIEAIEREQRLNLHAMSGTPGAFLNAWLRIAAPEMRPREADVRQLFSAGMVPLQGRNRR